MLAGEPLADPVTARVRRTLGRNWRWVRGLAARYEQAFGGSARPRRSDVVGFLKADDGLHSAAFKYKGELRIAEWIAAPPVMHPVDAARLWPVPKIETQGELAAWLGVTVGELEWFGDLKRLNARTGSGAGPTSHYHYRVLAKQGGNIRLIEAPKEEAKRAAGSYPS